ncbi:MAG TPA: MmgE/PrpD family protein [Methylomirabilota bacterium]|jgi:2-methylcitrate dehydratase PrpD|nr:MmgE/PrpD family protein [Methylomirabilota bacterium]
MDYLDRLSQFVEAVSLDRLPDEAVQATRLVLLDTIGAMAAGSAQPENRRLAATMHERRSRAGATLIGHGGRVDPLLATFANATAGVALEVDEGSRLGGGHPAIHVVPAALAVAEDTGADGRRLLESIIAGYEVCSRLGSATTPKPNVHSHGTWGTIGTAVAVARLAGLDAAGIRSVINLSASMSPANTWTTALEGVTIRNAYPGRSGLEGILAVDLHRAGFTGLPDAPSDVYGTILADRFEPERALDGLGGPPRIQQNYFKLYACCRYNHFALDALLALSRAGEIPADQVERVVVTTIPFGPRMAGAAPTSMLGAKFSIPYAVAATLVLGRADVSAFAEPALADPRIRALAARVEVRVDPEMSPRRADHPTAHVEVALKDGRTLAGVTTVVRGDFEDPVPAGEIVDKFVTLTAGTLGVTHARHVVDLVGRAETLKDVRDLTARLVPLSQPA